MATKIASTGLDDLLDIKSFETLYLIDKFGGAGPVEQVNEFFIVFRVRNSEGKLFLPSVSGIGTAISNGFIEVTSYIGPEKYTLSLLGNNPDACNFIVRNIYQNDERVTNVIHLTKGVVYGYSALSVCVKMSDDISFSTAHISEVSMVSESFVVFHGDD